MISPAIYTLLSGIGRIYPIRATQGAAWPFTTYHIVSCEITGTKTTASRVDVYRVQFNAWSEQYDDLNTIDAAIRAILDGYSGTVGTLVINSARMEGRNDNFDDGAQYYCRTMDYVIRVIIS
jgi:hypothetical protein